MKKSSIHIGKLIRAQLKSQHRTVAWLADKLLIQRPNCYRILRAESIDTSRLMLISQFLHHDFFAEYSKCLAEISVS